MTEPVLPIIAPAVLKEKPKPSGECPGKTKLLLFLAIPLAGVVVGAIVHYLGIVVGFLGVLIAMLPNLLTGMCGAVLCIGVIFAIIVVLAVVFGYPAVAGAGIGELVYQIGKLGKCRNPKVAALSAVLTGIVAYAAHLAISALTTGHFAITTMTTDSLANAFDITISGTPWWIYTLIVIEFIILVVVAASTAKTETENDLYCEAHGVWYGPWMEATYPLEIAPAIAETLEASQVRGLDVVSFVEATTFPHLKVHFRRCPSSAACELQFKVDLNWQEEKIDKKGAKTMENKTKVWVNTMVTPSLGFTLQNALRLEEAKLATKNKKKK